MVRTSLAAGKFGSVSQFIDLVDRQHGCLIACLVALARDQSGTECTHDSGNVRTGSMDPGDLLETSKDSVIVEGSTLYNDIVAEIFGIGELDNLK